MRLSDVTSNLKPSNVETRPVRLAVAAAGIVKEKYLLKAPAFVKKLV